MLSRISHDALVGRRLLLIVALVVTSCAGVWAGGCADQAETQAAAIDLDPAAAEITYPPSPRSDWYHILAVLEELRERPPSRPLVVLLGGSSGRESTVSDESWTAELGELGSSAVAYNLSSRNKTFTHDLDLVRLLPRTRTLVFIGVNLGRFTVSPEVQARGPATLPDDLEFSHNQHHYARRVILSPEQKQLEIDEWLGKRSGQFGERCAANRAILGEVVRVCLARGYEPVLLELPRDKEAIGDRLDDPIASYQRGCRAVA